jgi:hypothetical protein
MKTFPRQGVLYDKLVHSGKMAPSPVPNDDTPNPNRPQFQYPRTPKNFQPRVVGIPSFWKSWAKLTTRLSETSSRKPSQWITDATLARGSSLMSAYSSSPGPVRKKTLLTRI